MSFTKNQVHNTSTYHSSLRPNCKDLLRLNMSFAKPFKDLANIVYYTKKIYNKLFKDSLLSNSFKAGTS